MLNNVEVTDNKERNIFNFLEISEKNIVELNYLIELAKKLDDKVLLDAKENIFQFNCKFGEDGRNETFGVFYKKNLISSIMWKLFEEIGIRKSNKNEIHEEVIEDFALSYYDIYLDQDRENNGKYFEYLLKNDLSKMNKEEVINHFENEFKEEFKEEF